MIVFWVPRIELSNASWAAAVAVGQTSGRAPASCAPFQHRATGPKGSSFFILSLSLSLSRSLCRCAWCPQKQTRTGGLVLKKQTLAGVDHLLGSNH